MLTESQKREFLLLFQKYKQRTASPEEISFLEAYYKHFDLEEKLSLHIAEEDLRQLENRIYRKIQSIIDRQERLVIPRKTVFTQWQKIAAAVFFFVLAGTAVYFIRTQADRSLHEKNQARIIKEEIDLLPGGNKAVLTLADGTSIVLDSTKSGHIASQGNTSIVKSQSGLLAYHSMSETKNAGSSADIKYNTITTPNGGLYEVVLSDGSKVWLNAASSLRYPASFTESNRQVELVGEAYFEVARQTRMSKSGSEKIPFIVHTAAGDIKVLGTHFNVNAYSNESAVRTTLLEGSVKVDYKNSSLLLKPGMQSRADWNGMLQLAPDVNLDDVMAWKNGEFRFRGADIETVMRQMARWYDVEITYAGKVNEKFYVEIPRKTNASELFRILETTRAVHFQIKGKKVIVLP